MTILFQISICWFSSKWKGLLVLSIWLNGGESIKQDLNALWQIRALEYPFPKQALVFTCLQYKATENTGGKWEIARNKQFLLFPQCFLPVWRSFCHFHQIWNCCLQTLSVCGGGHFSRDNGSKIRLHRMCGLFMINTVCKRSRSRPWNPKAWKETLPSRSTQSWFRLIFCIFFWDANL